MNIINMLKNVAFMVDSGPDENSELWKLLEEYQDAVAANQPNVSDICSLETVLESKDILSFLQHNHQPLTNFLTTKEHLKKLLEYITSCPDSKTILSQQSCKILCHNSASVREAVFSESTENLDILFGFQDEDQLESTTLTKLDPMHSGLLTQVVQKFLNTHNWYMVDYLSSKEALKEKPEQLLFSPGLLQTLVDANYCYSGSALGQWMESINMVDMLVSSFKGEQGDAAVSCAAEVLRIIIQSISPLLQQFESKEVIAQLLQDSFNPENPVASEAQTEVTSVCKFLCEKYNNEGGEQIPTPLIPILDRLEDFNAILAPSADPESIINSSGNIVPFGMRRMKVVEMYAALLCVGSEGIDQVMLDKGVFQDLLNAFFKYKWNNILQTSVMAMFHMVFHSERHHFSKQILEKTTLLSEVSVRLMDDLEREKAGEPVSAYRGFFRTFSKTLLNLRAIPELAPVFESNEDWNKLSVLLEALEAERRESEENATSSPQSDATNSETPASTDSAPEPESESSPALSDIVIEENVDHMEVEENTTPSTTESNAEPETESENLPDPGEEKSTETEEPTGAPTTEGQQIEEPAAEEPNTAE